MDGNAIDDIMLIEDPERNFAMIMKDGRIYKNTVRGRAVAILFTATASAATITPAVRRSACERT